MKKLFVVLAFSFSLLSIQNASAELQSVEDRLQRLERIADNPVLVQLSRRLAEQQREIQTLYDEVDRLKFKLRQAENKLSKHYSETDERLSKLEKIAKEPLVVQASKTTQEVKNVGNVSVVDSEEQVVSGVYVSPDSKPAQKKTIIAEKKNGASSKVIKTHPATNKEKQAYKAVFNLMKKSKYQAAQKGFKKFREQYSESSLASNASYWNGEALMVLGKDTLGLSAFQDVYLTYPVSYKAPAAMLRAADTLKVLGDTKQAKVLYERLIEKYPDSKIALKAKTRIR